MSRLNETSSSKDISHQKDSTTPHFHRNSHYTETSTHTSSTIEKLPDKQFPLMKDYMNHWLHIVTGPYVKQSTYSLYGRIIERHLLPAFGNFTTNQLTSNDIRSFIHNQLTIGRIDGNGGLSPKTVCEQLSLLNSILKCAINDGLLYTNPLRGVRRPKIDSVEMRVFSPVEQKLIENAVKEMDDPLYLGITVCLYTGLRLGELCALKWRNVDFIQNTISVTSTMQRIQNVKKGGSKTQLIIDTPKSKHSLRTLPIPQALSNKLKLYHKSLPAKERKLDKFVFSQKGNRCIEPRLYEKYFQNIILKTGISKSNFHALRHTFATRCIELQMDVKSLSEILGHSNVSVTLNKYVHSFMEQKRKCIEKLNAIIIE